MRHLRKESFNITCIYEGADSLEGRWEMKGWEVGDGVMGGGRKGGGKWERRKWEKILFPCKKM